MVLSLHRSDEKLVVATTRRVVYQLKEQNRPRMKQNTQEIKGFYVWSFTATFRIKNHRLVQSVDKYFLKYTSWVRFPD